MISGIVRGLTPTVPLTLEDGTGGPHRFVFVVDTGFNGALALPSADIQRLQLPHVGEEGAVLADGSNSMRRVFATAVLWGNERREVRLLESGLPLLGMALLNGNRLAIDVAEGGLVSVEPL